MYKQQMVIEKEECVITLMCNLEYCIVCVPVEITVPAMILISMNSLKAQQLKANFVRIF